MFRACCTFCNSYCLNAELFYFWCLAIICILWFWPFTKWLILVERECIRAYAQPPPPQKIQFMWREMLFYLFRYPFRSARCHLLQGLWLFEAIRLSFLSYGNMAIYCRAIFKTCKCHHPKDIISVAFHCSYPLFASCSEDNTAYVFMQGLFRSKPGSSYCSTASTSRAF